MVPANPEARAELEAFVRNWYSMYLEAEYFPVQETMQCVSVLRHEGAKSHESEDKEDGRSKVCHEQLVAEKALQRREKCVPCLRRTRSF